MLALKKKERDEAPRDTIFPHALDGRWSGGRRSSCSQHGQKYDSSHGVVVKSRRINDGDCWSFSQNFAEKVILDRSDNRISAEVVSRPI